MAIFMGTFIVSARKYRPATFESVVGQQHITSTLKNAIRTNQLAQAFLFCGPRGVGKTTCARILAKTINCMNLTADTEACDACESCKSFANGSSLNIFELDAASNNSVEDIRALVQQISIPPQMGQYKVYIIDEVHMLSTAAFNAFLKTLEEPPAHAKFILATTEKHKIIPTILSRCQVYDFKRINTEDIVRHLAYVAQQENVSYEPEALHVIARKAEGGLRDALSAFDQLVNYTHGKLTYKECVENLNMLDHDVYFQMVDHLRSGNVSQALLLHQSVLDRGFDDLHFITGLSEHLRNVIVSADPVTHRLLEASEQARVRFGEQAVNCGVPLLMKMLEMSNDYEYRYRDAGNKHLHVEVALMRMAMLVTNATIQGTPPTGQPASPVRRS